MGGIWGSTFASAAVTQRVGRAPTSPLTSLETEEFALFAPVDGKLEGQTHESLCAELRRVHAIDDGRDDIGRQRRKPQEARQVTDGELLLTGNGWHGQIGVPD